MFVNRMPRYEILSEDSMATLDRGWRRIVSACAHSRAVASSETSVDHNGAVARAQAEAEAEAQAQLMQTQDFHRAYEAFAAKRTPEFKGD